MSPDAEHRHSVCLSCGSDDLVTGRIVGEPMFLADASIRGIPLQSSLVVCLECGATRGAVDTSDAVFRGLIERSLDVTLGSQPDAAPAARVECGRCGHDFTKASSHDRCPRCGQPIEAGQRSEERELRCAACGESVPASFDTCWSCGAGVRGDETSTDT